MNRREFLRLSLSTAGSALLANSCSPSLKTPSGNRDGKQLNIYSWPDYIHPEAIPEFEKRYGIKVVYDTVSSNEALIAKFQAGGADYDIVVPSNYAVSKLRELGCLRPIEHDRLKNFGNLMPRFQNSRFDPGCQYSIPYTFGTTGIAYNTAASRKAAFVPTDWDAFWNEHFAGRMTLLEDPREVIGLALKRQGHSYNTQDQKLIQAACADLKTQKPLTMCYTSDQAIIYLTSGDSWLSLTFSGDAQQASRANNNIKYVIPTSGTSMWLDNLCIPKNAPHPEYAHLWLDYMLEPQVSAALSNYTYYASPNAKAMPLIKQNLIEDQYLYPSDSILDRCEEIQDIGQAIFIYDRLWTELKCT
ncbi:MAG: spermidine/putrescine ABC transporter substrate-binding protein [Candidatus Obscuribacterales bacterium]|nr:spermidine/putrescine ABC transporter substrate-binding protein [Candidatus Obscuribacterales bacterium]